MLKVADVKTQSTSMPEMPAALEVLAIDWVERHALQSPNALAQFDVASDRRFTFREMNDRVGRVAASLKALGIKPGDRVGYLLQNSSDILEIMCGCWRIGAICLALNFRLIPSELEFLIGDAEPKAVFFDTDFAATADELMGVTAVEHWIETDGVGGDTPYEHMLAAAVPILRKEIDQPLTDICLLMHSSGTTGRPKGVIITHQMMFYSALNVGLRARITNRCVNLAMMPLFHIGAINGFTFPALYFGAANVIQRVFDPEVTLDLFDDRQIGITHFLAVPAAFNAMRDHPKSATTDFGTIQVAVSGAETVPDTLVEWWLGRGVFVQEAYGMTETAAGISILEREDLPEKIGSAGRALMHIEVKAVRMDGTNVDADPGELGELWMRGASVTPGYWNRPDANEECFVDGWLRSGDIGYLDADDYIYIEDRLKDMYISGGENVYPAEIENVLYQMEQIAEVAVVGVPDEKWGEVGCAAAVLQNGAQLSASDLAEYCAGKLARYKVPAKLITLDELPRNGAGKVLKPQLRALVNERLAGN